MAAYGDSKVVDKSEIKEKPIHLSPVHGGQLEKEDLAPDGGWGWVVVAGMIVVTLVTIGQAASFGLVYGDFLDASGKGGSALTFVNLMFMVSFSAAGLISNELLKRYSIKPVGVIGAVIYAFANTALCLVPNIPVMMILILIQGTGVGIMITISNISFNAYFVKRRTKVMGFAQVIIGLGAIGYPLLAGELYSVYGFRGCVALLGAISFNGIVSMYAMDPVERHYKMSKDVEKMTSKEEDQAIRSESGKRDRVTVWKKVESSRRHSMGVAKEWEQKNGSVRSLRLEAEHEKLLLIDTLKTSHKSQDRNSSDIETRFRLRPGKCASLDFLANSLSMSGATSMSSVNGIASYSPIPEDSAKDEDTDEKKKSIRSILADFFELSLLRDGIYFNIAFGSSMTLLIDILFNGFLPMTMTSQGYTKQDIALTLTVVAVTELTGKILFALFAMFVETKARHVYLISVYCLACCRIAFFYCDSLVKILIVHGLSGMVRSVFMMHQMLVLAEHVKIERFPAAWGLFTVINGTSAIVVCPLIGFIKDLTDSYVIAQYMLLGGLLLCLIPWTIEILIFEVFARKKTTEIANQMCDSGFF